MKRLGEFEQLLLFSLLHLGDDAYGRRIRALIHERTGRDVSPGAIYTALDRLEEHGMVSSYVADATSPRGGRRPRHYRLERAGREALSTAWHEMRAMAEGLESKLSPSESSG